MPLTQFPPFIKESTPSVFPCFNPSFGTNLTLANGGFSGTPDKIHNGLDSVEWTATSVVGSKFDFNSSDRSNTGSFSVKIDNAAVGDIIQFNRGSDLDFSLFAAITMAVNIDKNMDSFDSISIYGWDVSGAVQVGDKVFIEDFINVDEFDIWQFPVITLSALGLDASTTDAIRIEIEAKSGVGPTLYLDDIQVEETGAPEEFTIIPAPGTKIEARTFTVTMKGTGTLPLDPDKIIDADRLANGILFSAQILGVPQFLGVLTAIGDSIMFGSELISVTGGSPAEVIGTLRLNFIQGPLVLDSSLGDFFTASVQDDLPSTSLTDISCVLSGNITNS